MELEEEDFVLVKDIFIDQVMGRFGKYNLSLILYEIKQGTIRGSVRSGQSAYDCSKICDMYESGGGHVTAGGFRTSKSIDEIMKIIYKGMINYRLSQSGYSK